MVPEGAPAQRPVLVICKFNWFGACGFDDVSQLIQKKKKNMQRTKFEDIERVTCGKN